MHITKPVTTLPPTFFVKTNSKWDDTKETLVEFFAGCLDNYEMTLLNKFGWVMGAFYRPYCNSKPAFCGILLICFVNFLRHRYAKKLHLHKSVFLIFVCYLQTRQVSSFLHVLPPYGYRHLVKMSQSYLLQFLRS